MDSEVLIIGGGVIGLSIARALRKREVSGITILERGEIGKESSFAAAGMLAPQSETDSIDDFFRLCDESNKLYPKFANDLYAETGVDIELDQSGTLYLAFNDADVKQIRARFELQRTAGLAVEHLNSIQIRQAEPFVSPDVREGLYFENDWQVENRKLLLALASFAKLNDIAVVENENIERLLFQNGEILGVASSEKEFFAKKVIFATGAWTSLIKTDAISLPTVKPIRGQMISYHTAKRLFSRVIYSPRGYIVPRKMGRVLAGATTEDVGYDKNTTDFGISSIRENAIEIAPSLVNLPTDETWAGLRPFSGNGTPVLGRFPGCENVFIATAHYRNGILLAPMTAEILADQVTGIAESKYLEKFGVNRTEISAVSS